MTDTNSVRARLRVVETCVAMAALIAVLGAARDAAAQYVSSTDVNGNSSTGAGKSLFRVGASDDFTLNTRGQTSIIGAGAYDDMIFGSGTIDDGPSGVGRNNGNNNDFLIGLNNNIHLAGDGKYTSGGNFIFGYGANVSGSSNVVMGYNAATSLSGEGDVSLGAFSNPGAASMVTAIGYGAMAGSGGDAGVSDGTVAIGNHAFSDAIFPSSPLVIGSTPGAGVAIGDLAGQGATTQSSAIIGTTAGQGSTLAETELLGQGAGRQSTLYVSTGIGIQALEFSKQLGTTAIGPNAGMNSSGQANIYIGYQTGYAAQGSDNVLVGNAVNLHATTFNFATGLGVYSYAVSQSTAVGGFASAAGPHSVALGFKSSATGANSVAIGANSTDGGLVNVVSVGATGATRKLINVSAGEISAGSTEAVNGDQLYASNRSLRKLIKEVAAQATHGSKDGPATSSNSGSNGLVGQSTGAGDSGTITIGAQTGGGALSVAGTSGTRAVTGVSAGKVTASSVDAVNGAQLYTTNLKVKAAQATADTALATADNSVQYDSGTNGQSVTLNPGGPSAQVHNLAAGVAPTDAANVAQVQAAEAAAVSQANTYTNLQLAAFSSDFRRRLHQGLAGGAALANLPTSIIPGKGMIAVAVGGDQGEGALAIGISRVFEDRHHTEVRASVSVSPNGGDSLYGAGVGWHF